MASGFFLANIAAAIDDLRKTHTRPWINFRNVIVSFVTLLDQCTCIGTKEIFVSISFVYLFLFTDLYTGT